MDIHSGATWRKRWIDVCGDGDAARRYHYCKKDEGSLYSSSERRVPELIPVLGSQPAGDVSHKPGGRLTLLGEQRYNGCEQFA